MAKPKAPVWLREAFRDGVDEEGRHQRILTMRAPAYVGASGACWLAQHDPARRPCSGPHERFHFVGRQRVENAMWDRLRDALIEEDDGEGGTFRTPFLRFEVWDLTLLAAWDPRNGGVGCEHHHRRFDGHACSSRAPKIVVPRLALPAHVEDWGADYGLEHELERKFP